MSSDIGAATGSGIPVEGVYRPDEVAREYDNEFGDPGAFPFTRGPHETMYRGRLCPICVGRSNATESPVWPASSR